MSRPEVQASHRDTGSEREAPGVQLAPPEEAQLNRIAEVVLSRCVGEAALSGQMVRQLNRALRAYAGTAFVDGDLYVPAPCPSVVPAQCSTGLTVGRSLGYDQSSFRKHWARQVQEQGYMAVLPPAELRAFVSSELHEVARQVILDGPGTAVQRFERVLAAEALREVDADRSREAGTISDSFLRGYAGTMKRLLSEISELARRTSAMSGPLLRWHSVPKLTVPSGQPSPRDRQAPPLWLLRRVLRELDEELESRLGCPLQRQEERVRSMSHASLRNSAAFRLARDRATLAVLATLGSRVTATSQLTRADLVYDHLLADGTRGPALRLRPGKTMDERAAAWKPIPGELAAVIRIHHAFVDAWAGHSSAPSGWPMFAATLTEGSQRWCAESIADRLAGQGNSSCLLPKYDPDNGVGYSPHRVRSATTQAIRGSLAREYCSRERLELGAVGLEAVAEALTDHKHMKSDIFGYAGANTREGREHLSGVGTQIMWALLTTEHGARRVFDEVAFRRAVRKRNALSSELTRLEAELASVFASGRGTDAILEVQRLTMRERQVHKELRAVADEIHALRTDATRSVPLLNDRGGDLPQFDPDEIEREEAGELIRRPVAGPKPVRDWLTLAELGQLAGTKADATPRNWIAGKGLTARDPNAPFEPDAIPVDSSNPRRRRILVSGIKDSFLDQGDRRVVLSHLLGSFPKGWSSEVCAAPAIADYERLDSLGPSLNRQPTKPRPARALKEQAA